MERVVTYRAYLIAQQQILFQMFVKTPLNEKLYSIGLGASPKNYDLVEFDEQTKEAWYIANDYDSEKIP